MSNKFAKLNDDEEVNIEVINNGENNTHIINNKDIVHLILRNLNNENIKYSFDKTKLTNIKDLRLDVCFIF
jgi:hypothetical protein